MKRVILMMLSWAATAAMAAPYMYVPAGETNEVIIIDLKTDKVIGRIAELENAHGLAASANSEYVVAGSMLAGVAQKPTAVSEAEHAAHHASGMTGPEQTPSYVSIIDRQQKQVVRRLAVRSLTHHTAISPDGKLAIAVHSGAGGISVIDLKQMAVIKTLPTGAAPNYAVFSPDGKHLYISNAGSGTVSEIDTGNWSVAREFSVGKEPEHMALARDGVRLYVANVADGTAVAVDLKKGAVVKSFAVGAELHGIDVSDDGKTLFVAAKGDNRIARIDLKSGTVRSSTLEPAPYHLEYVDKLGKLYVSSRKLPKIWVVDPETLKVIGEIDIGQGVAHQMVIIER